MMTQGRAHRIAKTLVGRSDLPKTHTHAHTCGRVTHEINISTQSITNWSKSNQPIRDTVRALHQRTSRKWRWSMKGIAFTWSPQTFKRQTSWHVPDTQLFRFQKNKWTNFPNINCFTSAYRTNAEQRKENSEKARHCSNRIAFVSHRIVGAYIRHTWMPHSVHSKHMDLDTYSHILIAWMKTIQFSWCI